ncbi:TadE/TadG family type IV pilus assembly protein [Microvirga sp. GCM10011540]|uniref:TadE/TadG family type IV pilus assembly protein n=1 Tax=Microvirga sp. GCM10011540 TaxID=3317338 RepID=UPI00360FCFA4
MFRCEPRCKGSGERAAAGCRHPCSTRRERYGLWRDCRGVAGIEFALVAGTLSVLMLNVVEIGRYAYIRMQVENAAQVGAQAAWRACDQTRLPATINCPNLNAAVLASIGSTSLGDSIKLQNPPSEGYYCVTNADVLQRVADVTNRPADCSAVGEAGAQPGNYIKIDVTYSYKPWFLDLTVAQLFGDGITGTAYMRLL